MINYWSLKHATSCYKPFIMSATDLTEAWPRGATPCRRSRVADESARLQQRRSCREELPHIWGQGWRPGGATPHQRPGAAAGRSYPKSKEQWLHGRRRAERSYSTFKVRRGGCEEICLIQGKEQWLRFAGAAVKRHPTSRVRETQVRQ